VNLAQIIALHGRYRADVPAIEAGERIVTYGALDLMVRRLVTRLKRGGVGQGDLVGLWLRDTPEHVAAMLAVARLGATMLPMDWRWTPVEAARIFARFPVAALVMEEDLQPPEGLMALVLTDLAAETPDQSPPASADWPFLYSLSSGTTGESKAVVTDHGCMLVRATNNIIGLSLQQRERYLLAIPMVFGGARVSALAHLVLGATVVLFPTLFEPPELVEGLAMRRIDTVYLTPTSARALLKLPLPATGPLLAVLRRLVITGAKLHPEERRQIRARLCPRIYEVYGSISTGPLVYSDNADHEMAPEAIGRPFMGLEVEIVDDEGGPLPPGESGWLRARGPSMASAMVGTLGRGDERIEDGWVYPGDLGRFDAAGYLYLEGRGSEVIKRAGATIHAAEIERVLASHPDVIESAVVGAPDPELGETVVAFVVLRTPVEPKALTMHCRRQLTPYKVPRRFVVLDALPRNPNGKVLKRELLQRLG